MSQRDVASPGVTYAFVSRVEAGEREPSIKALRKLAPKLGVSPYYLEHGFDEVVHVIVVSTLEDPGRVIGVVRDAALATTLEAWLLDEGHNVYVTSQVVDDDHVAAAIKSDYVREAAPTE